MANTGLAIGDVADAVRTLTGRAASDNVMGVVAAGYQRFLSGERPGDPSVFHAWSFLKPEKYLRIRASVTGTGSITHDGSTTSTLTDDDATAVFDDDADTGEYVTVDGGGTFGPITVVSTSVVTWTGVAAEVIAAKEFWTGAKYDLPADFGGLVDQPVYIYNSSQTQQPLSRVDPEIMKLSWGSRKTSGTPRAFAIEALEFVEGTGQRYAILLDVPPDAARVIRYRYRVNQPDITDSDDGYFLGGVEHGQTIRALVLAQAELELQYTVGIMEADAQRRMLASIVRDQVLMEDSGIPQIISTDMSGGGGGY